MTTSHTPALMAKQKVIANEEIRRIQRKRIAILESSNEALIEAITGLLDYTGNKSMCKAYDAARAAIAKATS